MTDPPASWKAKTKKHCRESAPHDPDNKQTPNMRYAAILTVSLLSLPLTAVACPIGMLFNGNGCSPPYERNMDDWIREQRDYIDSLGPKGPPAQGLTLEEAIALEKDLKEQEKVNEEKRRAHAKGLWNFDTASTPEGKLCVAVFSKYTQGSDGTEGGMVAVMGFQPPKQDAWLIFSGTGLPKPRDVRKLRLTLQQDDEPGQTVEVFNYKLSPQIGSVAFAVPGLKAALDGMRDEQLFKLILNGKTVMSIVWTGGAKAAQEIKQCSE